VKGDQARLTSFSLCFKRPPSFSFPLCMFGIAPTFTQRPLTILPSPFFPTPQHQCFLFFLPLRFPPLSCQGLGLQKEQPFFFPPHGASGGILFFFNSFSFHPSPPPRFQRYCCPALFLFLFRPITKTRSQFSLSSMTFFFFRHCKPHYRPLFSRSHDLPADTSTLSPFLQIRLFLRRCESEIRLLFFSPLFRLRRFRPFFFHSDFEWSNGRPRRFTAFFFMMQYQANEGLFSLFFSLLLFSTFDISAPMSTGTLFPSFCHV